MKLATGTRIGQSRQELIPAVIFSFFLHVFLFSLALFLYTQVQPRAFIPQAYRVKLVALPADLVAQTTPAEAPAPQPEKKQERKAASKAKSPETRKSDMAGVKQAKKQARTPEPPDETVPAAPGPAGASGGGVAVSTPEDFKFAAYGTIIREKIRSRWHPQEGMRGLKATVSFRILRSGRVGESHLAAGSGNFYFDQAAMRAILSSSPFPPLPEEFPRQYADFIVDLTPRDL